MARLRAEADRAQPRRSTFCWRWPRLSFDMTLEPGDMQFLNTMSSTTPARPSPTRAERQHRRSIASGSHAQQPTLPEGHEVSGGTTAGGARRGHRAVEL